MRVDDFVLLGRTVPEESKKYGHRVCSAGYSFEMDELLRVYPLPVVNHMAQWHVYELELTRNCMDTRKESWTLPHRTMEDIRAIGCKHPRKDFRHTLDRLKVPSIGMLNERRRSLGIIKLSGDAQGTFTERNGTCNPSQGTLFEYLDRKFGANTIDIEPRLWFEDKDGEHCLQVREIGAYEWIRNHREDAGKLWMNYRINKPNCEVYLLVGNMAHQRNVWLIINVFVFAKDVNGVFDFAKFAE